MASWEVLALDTVTPQIRAPGAGDTYAIPRDMIISTSGLGYWFSSVNGYGTTFNSGGGSLSLYANGFQILTLNGSGAIGANFLNSVNMGPSAGTYDVGFTRTAAGVVKVTTGGGTGAGVIQTPALTVATLPAAATAGAGARSFVTDATATTFLTTVAGSGANKVPVVSDGTNWLIG